MLHSLTSIKKISLALGVAGIGALIGLPALAQSSSGAAPEFKLSKEGYIILCERTPLNSRCEGSPYYSASPTENPAVSPSGTTAPTQNLPSETDETDPSSAGETLTPGASGSDNSSPDGTTAPTQNLPGETSPQGSSPNGSMNGGSMNGGSMDGGGLDDRSPSNSSGTMTSPSNTTAPTQDLPSETEGK